MALVSAYWPGEGEPVDEQLLSTVGITSHALEQFVARAQPGPGAGGNIEAILRDCILLEGIVTYERPHWSRSRSRADWYIEIGDFLLCIVVWDERYGRWAIPTVVNGPESNTWQVALERGWTRIPMPPLLTLPIPPTRRGLIATWRAARELRHSDAGSLSLWRAVSLARCAHRERERKCFEQERAQHETQLTAYNQARQQAYATRRRL